MYGQGKYRVDAVKAQNARLNEAIRIKEKALLSISKVDHILTPLEALQLSCFLMDGVYEQIGSMELNDLRNAVRRTMNSLPRD